MSDHYKTLGVPNTATPDEIKKAYRVLASKHHPDKQGGDTVMFQKIEEAYRVLSDPQSRAQYDNPQPNWAGGGFPGGFSFNFGGANPFEDILSQFHRQHAQQSRTRLYTVNIPVTLEQVATGGKHAVTLQVGAEPKPVEIEIPRGVENGQQVRYNGIMPDGLVQVTFQVLQHSKFERNGLDIHQKYEISIWDLILGKSVTLHDIYGNELSIDIPPKTKPNITMRLAGKGMEVNGRRGNHLLLLSPVIPDRISIELLDLIGKERDCK